MKKSIGILCFSLAMFAVLLFANSANAVLSISGNVVQDSNTGLEWLIMSQTVNKSPDQIKAGAYGLKAAGWAHATISQIETLFLNAGMTGPFNGISSPWNFDAANHLIALFGNTGEHYGDLGRSCRLRLFPVRQEHQQAIYMRLAFLLAIPRQGTLEVVKFQVHLLHPVLRASD